MKQLYFCKDFDDERCYPLENLKSRGSLMGLRQITVTKAIPDTDKNYFSCNFYQTVGEKSQSDCGRFCDGYTPKNGKTGMCRYQKKCYEPTGEPFIVKIK